MAEITGILAANICGQFFFVIITTASTHCLVQNFQLICYSHRVNATSQYNDSGSSRRPKWPNGSDGSSGEILLTPCTRKKRLQRKITKDCHWIMFLICICVRGQNDCLSFKLKRQHVAKCLECWYFAQNTS